MRELVFVSFCLFILVLVCDACSFRISIIIQTSELRNRQCPVVRRVYRVRQTAEQAHKKLHMSHCGSLLLEPSMQTLETVAQNPRMKRRLDREKRFSVQAVVHASDDRAWFSPNHTRSWYRARLARRALLSKRRSRGTPFRRSARGPSRARTPPPAPARSRAAASRPPPG